MKFCISYKTIFEIFVILFLANDILSFTKNKEFTSLNALSNFKNDNFSTSMLEYFSKFVIQFTNSTIKDNFYKGDCEGNVTLLFNDSSALLEIYYNSGKFFEDFGDYTQCIKSDLLYTLIRFNYTNYPNVRKSLIGICFIKQCKNFIEILLKEQKLKNYLTNNYNIKISENQTKFFTQELQYKIKKNSFSIGFKIIMFLGLLYILIKLGFSLIGYFYFRKSETKYKISIENANKLENENKLQPSRINSNLNNSSNKILKKRLSYKIFSVMSFSKSLKYLFSLKNNFYNDSELQKFMYIKAFALLGINSYILFVSFIGRSGEIELLDLSTIKYLFIHKLGYYCSNLYILMTGLFFSYKLLSFISKTKNSNFLNFLKFYSIVLSRFIVYYLAAFVGIYYSKEIYSFLGNGNIIEDRFYSNENYNCYVNPLHLFIPLYLNYFNPSDFKQFLITEQCNSNILLISAEFYIFTFSIVIFYLIYKFKSKIFETIICFLPFISLIFLYFFLKKDETEFYTNREVLFSIRKILKPHSLFIAYFYGIIVGIIYFINNHSQVLLSNSIYIPFKFFSKINIFLHQRSLLLLQIISYIFLLFAFLVSLNFDFIFIIYPLSEYTTPFTITFDFFLNFIYIFEHKIYVFFFAIYFILNIHRNNYEYEEEKPGNYFHLLAVTRSRYCIILLSPIIADLVYIKILVWERFVNDFFLILFYIIANFTLSSIIGIFFHICLEFPFRSMIKKFKKI